MPNNNEAEGVLSVYVGIAALCKLFGKTRHAWYNAQWRADDQLLKDEIIIQMVKEIRTSLPRIGTRKPGHLLQLRLAEHNDGKNIISRQQTVNRQNQSLNPKKQIPLKNSWLYSSCRIISNLCIAIVKLIISPV